MTPCDAHAAQVMEGTGGRSGTGAAGTAERGTGRGSDARAAMRGGAAGRSAPTHFDRLPGPATLLRNREGISPW